MEQQKWIYVYTDGRGLWTASLYQGNEKIRDLGGSYPKSQSATLDAQITWGRNLELKIGQIK